MDYHIRPLTADDEALLWEMLRQGLQAGGAEESARESVRRPEFASYVEHWGREGDSGFVAHDTEEDQPIGAVWCRASPAEDPPKLAFAVKAGHRRRGIGAALLTQWVKANPRQSSVTLSVPVSNPAVRLYERFGYKVVRESDGSVLMQRDV